MMRAGGAQLAHGVAQERGGQGPAAQVDLCSPPPPGPGPPPGRSRPTAGGCRSPPGRGPRPGHVRPGHLGQGQGGAADVGLVHAAQPGRHDPPQPAGAERQRLEEPVLHLRQAAAGSPGFRGRHEGLQFRLSSAPGPGRRGRLGRRQGTAWAWTTSERTGLGPGGYAPRIAPVRRRPG